MVINEHNDAYFNGALFIGDSILEGVRQYVNAARSGGEVLGDAKFLSSLEGVALCDLVGDRDWGRKYTWQGAKTELKDIVDGLEIRRFFLFMGLNDLADGDFTDVDAVVDRCMRLISLLREWKPEAEVLVMTLPPKTASAWLPDYTANRGFGNPLIDEYAAALTAACEERGIPVIDVHSALSGEDGALPEEYCSDGFIHLSRAGREAVVKALYAYAMDKGE